MPSSGAGLSPQPPRWGGCGHNASRRPDLGSGSFVGSRSRRKRSNLPLFGSLTATSRPILGVSWYLFPHGERRSPGQRAGAWEECPCETQGSCARQLCPYEGKKNKHKKSKEFASESKLGVLGLWLCGEEAISFPRCDPEPWLGAGGAFRAADGRHTSPASPWHLFPLLPPLALQLACFSCSSGKSHLSSHIFGCFAGSSFCLPREAGYF